MGDREKKTELFEQVRTRRQGAGRGAYCVLACEAIGVLPASEASA